MLKLFANLLWIYMPGFLQKQVSRIFSQVFSLRLSRFFILPYCLVFGLQSDYLDQFEPESGDSDYSSYLDFFKRKYKSQLTAQAEKVWPCEGYICDWGSFKEKNKSIVKGHILNLNDIFNSDEQETLHHHFINVFLHNHNYHHVHSPIDGIVKKITQIPGDLIFLRPWFYKRSDVSYPAIRNERYVFEIVDSSEQKWYLAMVGGFGVGSIEVTSGLHVGVAVQAGQEIAKFNLGSTVCLATPIPVEVKKFLQTVSPGEKLTFS